MGQRPVGGGWRPDSGRATAAHRATVEPLSVSDQLWLRRMTSELPADWVVDGVPGPAGATLFLGPGGRRRWVRPPVGSGAASSPRRLVSSYSGIQVRCRCPHCDRLAAANPFLTAPGRSATRR